MQINNIKSAIRKYLYHFPEILITGISYQIYYANNLNVIFISTSYEYNLDNIFDNYFHLDNFEFNYLKSLPYCIYNEVENSIIIDSKIIQEMKKYIELMDNL